MADSGSATTTSTLSSDTTTIPAGSTTTVPEGNSSTTVPGGTTDAEYMVGININGNGQTDSPESSGTLPGSSFSETAPLPYRRDGSPLLLWHDLTFPRPDIDLIHTTRQLLEERESSEAGSIQAFNVGDTGYFWVKDANDTAWRQVSATVQKSGPHTNIFVDNTLSIAQDSLELYEAEFEIMYAVLGSNIGVFSDRNSDGKVAILLYAMNDGGSVSSGYLGGYFWSKDFLDDSMTSIQGVRSNEMDVIYIRGNAPQGWSQVGHDFYDYNLTTLVHEYQHLVHFCVKVWTQGSSGDYSDVWIDEMMAMASETMYFKYKLQTDSTYTHPSMQDEGYLADRIEYYAMDPQNSIRNGHGLTYWDNNGNFYANYSLSYLFGQYLALQSATGQDIFKSVLDYMIANGVHDYRGVVGAASQKISGISSWEDLLKNFCIANIANESSGPHGYLGAFSVTPHGSTSPTVSIHNSGAVYRKVDGPWSAPADAGPGIRFYETSGTPASGTTTVPGGGGTTSSIRDGICTGSYVLGTHSSETNLIRRFRDEILGSTQRGQELIQLYYLYSPDLNVLLAENPDLRLLIKKSLITLMPLIQSVIEDGAVILNHEHKAVIQSMCAALSANARRDISALLQELYTDFEQGTLLSDLGIESSR